MKLKLQKTTLFLCLLASFFIHSAVLQAQSDPTGASPVTKTYAIANATVIQAPGKVLENATIIFDDGLISAIGTNVNVPDNAQIIDGTDLFIYPGFIDGMAYTGAVQPENQPRPNDLFAPNPPNDYAGITPENQVINQLDPKSNDISAMRNLGFTVSHTVPHGRMLPGTGALISLIDTDNKDFLLIRDDYSMYSQFMGAPGAYPSNTLGIMAKFRNLYRNAVNAKNHTTMYADNSANLARPNYDRATRAFFPVIDKNQDVFYNASSILDAQRAIKLKNELGFNLTIGNLKEGWDLADLIKSSNTKVFLSLDLPKKPKEISESDLNDEIRELDSRRMEFYEKYVTQAIELEKAGIKFGFSTMGLKSNQVKSNIKTLVDNGLSEETTLAALTINAAELLGISSSYGSLENGKIANAIISDGSIFDDNTNIKYVFVDGNKFEFESKDNSQADAKSNNTQSILGTWKFDVDSPEGNQAGKLKFEEQNGKLIGSISNSNGAPDSDLHNLSFNNGLLTFDFSFDAGGELVDVIFTGKLDDDVIDAEATVPAFNLSLPFRAIKDEAK